MTSSMPEAAQFANVNIDAFMELSRIALSSIERLAALNLEASRSAVEEGIAASRSAPNADGDKEQPSAPNDFPATIFRSVQNYVQQLQAIAFDTRKEVADLLTTYQAQGGAGAARGADWLGGFDMFRGLAQQINAMTDATSRVLSDASERVKEAQPVSLTPSA